MCALNIAETAQQQPYSGEPIVNDVAFMVATKNGSGSQTSNNVLVMSLFKMGIPVNGKNLFPSNIKGLPTWYTIRASKHGYTARRATTEIVVAMNLDTAAEDVKSLPSGGVCIIPQDMRKLVPDRADVIYYELPVKDIIKEANIASDLRDRVANMVYVGAVAQLFSIPMDTVYAALLDNFNGKEKPAKINFDVVQRAFDWSKANHVKRDPYLFEPMNETEGKIVITGNEAGALGSVFGGVTVVAWYPITPSTSLVDSVISYKHLRVDPDTKQDTVAVVQAEDEIAAIGMIVGAGWAGARSMTATSGPGISLMAEFTGLAYYAEIPCVIWDITRMGPSTGLPTRTSQGDILFTHFLGHGDSRQLVLLPGSVEECFEFGWRSLDYAEQFQTPVFVLSDLDLGMNNWMAQPFEYPDEPMKRGKVLNAEQLESFIQEKGNWGRYMDYDNDGIPYRTLPGTDHARAAWFARGTGHNEYAVYSERADDWVRNMARLREKFETARKTLPQPETDITEGKKIGILSFGSNHDAIREARDYLTEQGVETNYMRVRALPLAESVYEFIRNHERVYVVENDFDGQLYQLVSMEYHEDMRHVKSLALGDSLPMTPKYVFDSIMSGEGK
jgi:2-oxoglutarate/2-oxoacid ferredoxin oxidoreductase subunit alpha